MDTKEAGSVVFSGPAGDVTVVWAADDEDRIRHLPVGEYAEKTTRIERMHADEHWFLSSTGIAGKPRMLPKGGTLNVAGPNRVVFQGTAHHRKGKLQLGFSIRGADRRGLSVYRNDHRVPVTYELLSAKGKVLASGKMSYG